MAQIENLAKETNFDVPSRENLELKDMPQTKLEIIKEKIKKHKLIIIILFLLFILLVLLLILFYKQKNANSPNYRVNDLTKPTAKDVTPTQSNSPTPSTNPTNQNVLTIGDELGPRPLITGGMGWQTSAVQSHEYFFRKAKDLGINDIRIMSVLKTAPSFSNLDNAINTLRSTEQSVLICLGELSSPQIPNSEIDSNAKLVNSMIDHLIDKYGINTVNSMPIELDNEYGGSNMTYLLNAYYNSVKNAEKKHPGLSIKIIIPAVQRGRYNNLDTALKYFKANNMSFYAISAHYYLIGAVKTPNDFNFSMWLNKTKEIINKYGYGSYPLYITEYGLSGEHKNIKLKESYNAAWLASRLNDKTYYNLKNTTFYMSAVYGQPFESTAGGWIGLFDGYSGSKAPYPVENEMELEKKFGNAKLYNINGLPQNTNIGGVTDNKGQWLIWNLTDSPININIPSTSAKKVGYIDKENGNANTIINIVGSKNNLAKESNNIIQRSNPFNDPSSGKERSMINSDNGIIKITIASQGLAFIGN